MSKYDEIIKIIEYNTGKEMTDEEKKGYNKLIANAKQMSLPL